MIETSNNIREEYINAALVMSENVPSKLKKIFNSYMNEPKYKEVFSKKMEKMNKDSSKYYICPSNLKDTIFQLIVYSLDNATSGTPKEALKIIKELRRNARYHLYLRNPEKNESLYEQMAEKIFELKAFDETFITETPENILECKQLLKDNAEEWYQNKETFFVDFPLFPILRPTKQVDYYLSDLSYFIIQYICKNWYSQLGGYMTKMPSDLISNPHFSLSGYSMQLEHMLLNNKLSLLEERYYPSEDGLLKIGTIVNELEISSEQIEQINLLDDSSDREEVLSRIRQQTGWALQSKALDYKDLTIFAYFYNQISATYFGSTRRSFQCRLRDIYDYYYSSDTPNKTSRYRTKNLVELLNRIINLSNYQLNATKYDSNNSIMAKLTMTLLQVDFFAPKANDKAADDGPDIIDNYKDKYKNMQLNNEVTEDDFVGRDLKNMILEIRYSDSVLESWKSDANSRILTNEFTAIEDKRTKAIIFILQDIRLAIYPSLETSIAFQTFFEHFNTKKLKPVQLKKILNDSFTVLKERGLIIDNFTIDLFGVNIKFLPYTDIEKRVYNVEIPKKLYASSDDDIYYDGEQLALPLEY